MADDRLPWGRAIPADFFQRPLPVVTLPVGTVLYRIHRSHRPARWFSPGRDSPPMGRFDDPEGEFRVCYLGESLEASFAETLLRSPGRRILALADLATRSVAEFRSTRALRLAQLEGRGLAVLGLEAGDTHGPYVVCGRWSRAIWAHQEPAVVEGLVYRSRFDNAERCIALFDRAAQAIEEVGGSGLLEDRARLRRLLRRYEVRLTR